jgi:Fe-S oxidoreductase
MSEKCSLCGKCKAVCPIFKVTLKELVGPRAKRILRDKGLYDKLFYVCTLCDACKQKCPLGVDIDIMKIRETMVKNGVETKANRELIDKLRREGKIY